MLSQTFPSDSEQEDDALKLIIMTSEQLQSVFTWLKSSFPGFTIQKIVSALDHYYHQKYKKTPIPRQNSKINRQFNTNQIEKINLHKNSQEVRGDKKQRKKNELKIVSEIFCEKGYGYSHIRQIFPNIQYSNLKSQAGYRNIMTTIVNKVIQDLFKKIKRKYRPNLQITSEQKYRIRQQLLHSHQWMAKISPQALATFLKLITKNFQNIRKPIEDYQMLELYNIIARRINDSFNLHDIEYKQRVFGEQIQKELQLINMPYFTKEIDKNLEILGKSFTKNKTIIKTFAELRTQEPKDQTWTLEKIQQGIQLILQKSVQKLMSNSNKQNIRQISQIFNNVDKNIFKQIMRNGKEELSISLVRHYVQKQISFQEQLNLIKLLNEFLDIRKQVQQKRQARKEQYYEDVQWLIQ